MKRICFPCTICFLVLFLSACSAQKSGSKFESHSDTRSQPADRSTRLDTLQDRAQLQVDYLTPVSAIKKPEIFVYKEKRRLYVIQAKVLVRDYPVALGQHPRGDKEKIGDGRTPEGDFMVCAKEPLGRFNKSLGLNYPGKRHAERAHFSGLLSSAQFKEILNAHEKKTKPPVDNPIGGRIAIHGGGAHKDWTDGCIALYDSDLEELFAVAPIGTPVSVRP